MSKRPLVFTPRRTAAVASVAALSLMIPMLGTSPAAAADPTLPDDVADVRVGLIQLGRAVAEIAKQPALSDDLPLTDTSVRDVLSLDTAIGSAVEDALAVDGDTTIDTIDDAFDDNGPITVTEVASADRLPGAPANSREWTMKIDLQAARKVALTYQDKKIEFGTAQLDGELAGSLDATIRFRYDPDAIALRTFAVVGTPDLTTHVWTRAEDSDATSGRQVDIPQFAAIDGFVQMDASGDATIDSTTELAMRDPNGRGQITTEDFQFSSAADLFTTTELPAKDAVSMDIGLSTSMNGEATGTISVGDRVADATTYAAPTIDRSATLKDLASLTRLQALTGFTQYTSALQTLEGSVDQSFPLLDRSLTDLYSPTSDLLGLLTEQATASIVCGAANSSPPSGAPRPGEVRYCQATSSGLDVAQDDPKIAWSSPDKGVKVVPVPADGTTAGTVGAKPTKNVAVSGGDGFATLRVSFKGADGKTHVARSVVPSIQALGQAVGGLGLGGDVTYDATKKALTIGVSQDEEALTKAVSVPTGGNGNLAPLTGLAGLCEAAKDTTPRKCLPTGDRPVTVNGQETTTVVTPQQGSADVQLGKRQFAADFGIGLGDDTEPVAGQPAPAGPAFYLVPGDDGLVYKVGEAKASLPDKAEMVARIGFLQADVDVDTYSVTQNGDAASVSVPTTTVTLPSSAKVDDAVTVGSLLEPTSATTPTVVRGLKASAKLAVRDSAQDAAGTRPLTADGTIDATWADLRPSALPKITTGGAYDTLRLLDIVPARQGVMGDGSGNGVVTDPGADYVKQFGLENVAAPDRVVNRPLYDLGGEESSTICTQYLVTSATSLTCRQGPLANDGAAAKGHPYVIDGDQNALRDIVIENLAGLLNTFNTPSDGQASNKAFPLVDVLPTEISAARDGLGKVINDVKDVAGTDAASVSFPASSTKVARAATMQDFTETFGDAMKIAIGGEDTEIAKGRSLGFTLDTAKNRLVFESSLQTEGTRTAPLRFGAGDSEVKVYGDDSKVVRVPISVGSKATFAFGVDLATGTSSVRGDTGTSEQITGINGADNTRQLLAGVPVDYGSAQLKSGAKADTQIGIGVGAVSSPRGSTDSWTPIADFPKTLEQSRVLVGDAQGCGATPKSAQIAACIKLPFDSASAVPALDVALRADEGSASAGGSMKAQPIAYRFLAEGLGALNSTFVDALDGDQTASADDAPVSLPLVGTDLDAGVDIPADVSTYVSTARQSLAPVEKAVAETDPVSTLDTELKKALGTLGTSLTAKKLTGTSAAPVILCTGGVACASGKTVADVERIEVPITLTGTTATDKPVPVPFQLGPIGSTVVTQATVPATADYTLKLTLGVARGKGSFVSFANNSEADPLLAVGVTSRLGDYSASTCSEWTRSAAWTASDGPATPIANGSVPAFKDAATARCLDAFVGKFPSVLVDRPSGNKAGTYLNARTVVTMPAPAGGSDTVFLPALADKERAFERSVTGDGKVSTYFESFAGKVGFFDVVGAIDLAWNDGSYGDGIEYGKLKLDVGTLNDAVLPGFKKALAWTAPLNPAVEQLSKPIPVVSDLSELVGQGPTSMLTLLQKKNTPINLIINLLQLQNVAAGKPTGEIDLRTIGADDIGGFKVSPQKLGVAGSCTESGTLNGKKYEKTVKGGNGRSGRCKPGTLDKAKQFVKGEKPEKDPQGLEVKKTVTRSPYISLPSVSLPVLQDTSQIFNLMQDKGDATMLYVDLGRAGVKGNITKNFGPFAVGPIPVTATLGGEVGLGGRFAFGFDTRGLSRRLEQLSTGDTAGFRKLVDAQVKPSLFSDGFYIDDLEKGVDVPEIQLTFTVTAGAAISIGIVSAGIQGGVTLDLSLDAFDPNGDGKIYSDEFAGASNGPSCAFNVSSGISFVLQFFFTIELLFYTVNETFDIVRSPRYKLFDFTCSVEDPVLATYDPSASVTGRGGTTTRKALLLNMGPRTDERGGYAEEQAEKFTVRQVGQPSGGKVQMQVSAFNLVQNYVVDEGTVVVANGGDGSDTVLMYPMPAVTTTSGNEPQMLGPGDDGYVAPTFSLGSVVRGGAADDTIETSNGDDDVWGDGGKDAIRTGLGNDVVRGGSDQDSIDGGQGDDRVFGDDGDDRVKGGPGADEVRGGGGADVLDGGIGADPAGQFAISKADLIRPTLDSGDLVVGGDGADRVTGGNGSDVVVGGAYDDAVADLTATTSVTVTGTTATGTLLDVPITAISTVKLPSETVIAQQCASDGTSGEVGPDTVTGGGESDVVIGGGGGDTLSGGGGDDRVCGRGGDDLLDGDGTDVVDEQQGADVVRGGSGRDRIYGSGGADNLGGDAGDDLVRGGVGDDTIVGGAGSDLLLGEKGLDSVDGDQAANAAAVPTAADDATATGRRIVCSTSTSIVGGRIDLNGDLAGSDTGTLEGMSVVGGVVQSSTAGGTFTGIVSDVVFTNGLADLDGDGKITARAKGTLGDTGSVPLAGLTGAKGNGDCILGGDEVDPRLAGGAGADYIDAGAGDDVNVLGGSGNDLVRGGDGDDTLQGDSGDDLVAGDAGDDILFGNADADVVRGGSGNDLAAGGSSVKDAADGPDEVLGDGDDDVVVGGNATLSRTALARTAIDGAGVTLLATPETPGDDDKVYGGVGDDWVFGQNGADKAYGGPGADSVEGGPGSDTVQGDDGDDLLVGGSSTTGAVTTDRSAEGTPDGDDTVVGDDGVDRKDGSDIMVGDNARLQVSTDVRSRWQRVRSGVEIALFDVPDTSTAPSTDASGDDVLRAGGKDDVALGQSGDDTIDAGAGDDGVEGGAGSDIVTGGLGDDEILGGSWTSKTADAGDDLKGEDGDDVIIGDNGTPASGLSLFVRLLDAPAPGQAPAAGSSGGDAISGGSGQDRIFGQSGADTLVGDDGVDVLEGGAGLDTMAGGAGDDVLTGGSSSRDGVIAPDRDGSGQLDVGDAMSGGAGDDVLAGDNARLDRTGGTRVDGTSLRSVQLFDLATASKGAAADTGGSDSIYGDDGRDLVFGQAGDDSLTGGSETDYLEGNDGADDLQGGAGEDDLVGGGSSRTGAVITVTGASVVDRLLTAPGGMTDVSASGLVDGNDVLDGGDARDVLLGDNGRITRGGPAALLGGGASGPHAVRKVAMADKVPGVWSGSDRLTGGQGDDDLYGQFDNTRTKRPGQTYVGADVPGDVLVGGVGDDALVGDQGVDVPTRVSALGAVNRTVRDKTSFVRELVRPRGTLVRVVTLTHARQGGDDLLVGDDGADSIHAGAGKDVVNAGGGKDVVFGGDGNDALWGGADRDRVFGGEDNDLLDVKRRASHPLLWKVAAPLADTDGRRRTTNGGDLLFGGAGADGLQADEGDVAGRRRMQGDRLIDWRAKVNVFKTCRTGRGTGKVMDVSSASTVTALREIAKASGAVGSSEIAIPFNERLSTYPGRPGFVCER